MKEILAWIVGTFGVGAIALSGIYSSAVVNPRERIKAETTPPQTYEVPSFTYHIVTDEELRRIYKVNGMKLKEGDILYGFTGKDDKGRWHVFTTRPRIVNGDATCTLGHEVQHIIWGKYHE